MAAGSSALSNGTLPRPQRRYLAPGSQPGRVPLSPTTTNKQAPAPLLPQTCVAPPGGRRSRRGSGRPTTRPDPPGPHRGDRGREQPAGRLRSRSSRKGRLLPGPAAPAQERRSATGRLSGETASPRVSAGKRTSGWRSFVPRVSVPISVPRVEIDRPGTSGTGALSGPTPGSTDDDTPLRNLSRQAGNRSSPRPGSTRTARHHSLLSPSLGRPAPCAEKRREAHAG